MKGIIISILIVCVSIGTAIWFSPEAGVVNNVRVENGMQIVELTAKGGYQPRRSVAKAGVPTVVRFDTNGTFDCSLSVRIPSLNISKFLPQTGSTDIDIGTQPVGLFRGSCGMGMYPFEINFE